MLTFASRRLAASLAAVVFLLALAAGQARSDDKDPKAGDAKGGKPELKKSADLPLEKVVMFSSGMGFFEHRGEVKGDAQVDLKFNVQDINDLLKSMVLEDEGGGRISTVTYESRDPVTKTLKTFAIDLRNNPTLGQILTQARGERVEVAAPDKLTGVILGVEKRKKELGDNKGTVEVEYLNLLTDDGFRSVSLQEVGRIKLLDEKLDAELRQALKVLAMAHSTDKKTVSLNFLGQGGRRVRVGYIQETPLWRTSYRLVLKDGEAPFLQGWAIVENTTEQDWNKVNLTLVSGRPISFIMDLYQPLYLPRPVVVPELFASLRPQSYDQSLEREEADFRVAGEKSNRAPMAPSAGGMGGGMGGMGGGLAKRAARADAAFGVDALAAASNRPMNIAAGVQSQAQAADVGELFQYAIESPVTLPRQQSAMLPIVNESIKGEKVSIYNPSVQAKHPLNGMKLKNTTALHLMQGPITVFDGGAYAGDAKVEDLQPGSERLVSYALDLDVEVAPESKGNPEQLLSVHLKKGVIYSEVKYERTNKYVIKNSGKKAKNVLIEYPRDTSWTLIAPKKPSEETRGMYRFAVQAEPGKPAKLDIDEERIVRQTVAITNLNDNLIAIYLNSKVVKPEVKEALKKIVKRKTDLADVIRQRTELEQKLGTYDQQQSRIRQNMDRLDRNSDLYRSYVSQLTKQETEIAALHEKIDGLKAKEREQQQSLDQFLLDLDV